MTFWFLIIFLKDKFLFEVFFICFFFWNIIVIFFFLIFLLSFMANHNPVILFNFISQLNVKSSIQNFFFILALNKSDSIHLLMENKLKRTRSVVLYIHKFKLWKCISYILFCCFKVTFNKV